MGKVIEQYRELKEKNPDKVILFEGGVFYNAIEDDCILLNEKIGLRISKNNIGGYIQCGFPIQSLNTYIERMKKNKIDYQIIGRVHKEPNIQKIKQRILREIETLDLENMTPLEAHSKLLDFQNKIKQK